MPALAAIVYVVAILAPAQAPSQAEIDALLDLCEVIRCHPPTRLSIFIENGEEKEIELAYPIPIVQPNGWVVVFPGTTTYITGRINDGILVDLVAVAEMPEENYIQIEMFQKEGEPDTYLKVSSHFQQTIKYRAGYMPPDGEGLYATSSCPVMPDGVFSFEHWPYPIFQIVMADFRVLEGDLENLVCE